MHCLAKMTKENHNPQTRLLISHDIPHRGANVPIGAQYIINDFAKTKILGKTLQDWIPLLAQAIYLETRPATIQQLIVRNNPLNGNLEYNTFLAPNGPYRQMVTFSPSDIQPAYKFVATSQGSECGVPVMQPSASLASSSGEVQFSFLLGAFGLQFFGELQVNALPNGTSSQRIAYFVLKDRVKIFWIGITTTILKSQHYSPVGILGWDGCPGGTQATSRGTGITTIPPSGNRPGLIPPITLEMYYGFSGAQIAPEFTFLPVSSALDEDNITAASLYSSHIGATYTPPANNTLLRAYVAQEKETVTGGNIYNIPHTDFTARNSRWIFNEMQGNTQPVDCDDYCEPAGGLSISGDGQICESGTYSISNLPPGATVTWSCIPANSIIIDAPNSSQTSISLAAETAVLRATVSSACGSGNVVIDKSISQGQYYEINEIEFSSNGLGGGETLCIHDHDEDDYANTFTVHLNSSNPNVPLTMEYMIFDMFTSQSMLPYPGYITINNVQDLGTYSLPPSLPAGWYNIEARIIGNTCGDNPTEWFEGAMEYADCGLYRQGLVVNVYPNPTASASLLQVTVDEPGKNLQSAKGEKINFSLYDFYRKKVVRLWTGKNDVKQHQLNISGIAPGPYILLVTKGKLRQGKQIQIGK